MLSDDQLSKAGRSSIPQYDAADLYVEELLSKVGAGKKSVKFATGDDDDNTMKRDRSREPQKPPNGKQDDAETQKYVRDLMKSVFQVEDAAAQIKGKYGGGPPKQQGTITSGDIMSSLLSSVPSKRFKPAPTARTSLKTSNLSKQEKLVLQAATQNEETTEEALIALELLQKYKKDPNFIQRELKDQAKKRDQVMGAQQQSKPLPKQDSLNLALIQEERHRAINERREQRKKDQKLKRLEDSKERLYAPKETMAKARKSLHQQNSDIDAVLVTSPTRDTTIDGGAVVDVQKIREAKLKIEQDALESQEEVKKIKEELKRFKQEIKEQEKAKRDLEAQQELQSKLQIDRARLQQDSQKAKETLFGYKISKLVIILSSVNQRHDRRILGQTFQDLVAYNRSLKLAAAKISKRNRVFIKQRFLREWVRAMRLSVEEKELQEFERAQQILMIKEQTADIHRRRNLKRRVYKALKKHQVQNLQEKALEIEHEQRKQQIDGFFEAMKERARDEEERVKREKLEKLQKDKIKDKLREVTKAVRKAEEYDVSMSNSSVPYMVTPSQLIEGSQESIDFEQYSFSGANLVIPRNEAQAEEAKIEYDIVPSRHQDLSSVLHNQPPSQSQDSHRLATSNDIKANQKQIQTHQQPPQKKQLKLPTRPRQVLDMELRAQARKERRAELQLAYDERMRAGHEQHAREAKAREEEVKKQKLLQAQVKRNLKEEEQRAKEERERERREEEKRIEEARAYYRRGLMIKYGIVPMCKEVERVRVEEMVADEQYVRWVKKNGLLLLRIGIEEQRAEVRRLDAKKMLVAKLQYHKTLLSKGILALQMYLSKQQTFALSLRGHYLRTLLKKALSSWSSIVPVLQAERQAFSVKENLLVQKFTLMRSGRRILKAWREATRLERIEREKNNYKQKMWSKVNSWLTDLDGKPGGQVPANRTPATLSTIGNELPDNDAQLISYGSKHLSSKQQHLISQHQLESHVSEGDEQEGEEFSFYNLQEGSEIKKRLERLKQLQDCGDDPYFTFSGDKNHPLAPGGAHHRSSQLTDAILPKNAAALFAQLDSQQSMGIAYLKQGSQGQVIGIFDDLSLDDPLHHNQSSLLENSSLVSNGRK